MPRVSTWRRRLPIWVVLARLSMVLSWITEPEHSNRVSLHAMGARIHRAKTLIAALESSEVHSTTNEVDWRDTTGEKLGRGSLLISRVEESMGCHDLRQPYFHKAVILIVEHEAEGSTKGLVLNRPSNLCLPDSDIVVREDSEEVQSNGDLEEPTGSDSENWWQLSFGGDIAGLVDEQPSLLFLHRGEASDAITRDVSEEILPGVWITSYAGATRLIHESSSSIESKDFHGFYGFSGWDPGQLEKEITRGSWVVVSMNEKDVWRNLQTVRQNQVEKPENAGISTWRDIIGPFHPSELKKGDDQFSDRMLKAWASEMLCLAKDGSEDDSEDGVSDEILSRAVRAHAPRPGSFLRGSSLSLSTPYLLYEQYLHKSTILLCEDEADFSLGLVLNLPTSKSIVLDVSNKKIELPIRYGGPSGSGSDEDPIVFLHSNPILRDNKVGDPIGDDGHLWSCSVDDVVEALATGIAVPSCFLAVQGFIVWEKEEGCGGAQGQVQNGNLDLVPTRSVDSILSCLRRQITLSEDTIDCSLKKATQAWDLGGQEDDRPSPIVPGTALTQAQLAEEALRNWLKIFLLKGVTYYPTDMY